MEIKNVICSNCGKEFKPSHNIKKTAKSMNRFCSSSCAASFNNKNRYKSGTPDIVKSKTSQRLKARNYAIRKLLNLPFGKKMNKSLKNNEIAKMICKFYVPARSATLYKTSDEWKELSDQIFDYNFSID